MIYYFDKFGNKKKSVLNEVFNENTDLYFDDDNDLINYLTEILTPEQKRQSDIMRGIRTKILNRKTVPIVKSINKQYNPNLKKCNNLVGPDYIQCKRNVYNTITDKLKVKSILLWTFKDSLASKFHKKHGFSAMDDLIIMKR